MGLFIYPTLMTADILLYDAEIVPVGKDQQQHIQLTRDLGERFNKRYGETFTLPNYYIPEIGAKIMNLQNPNEKMSKSAPKDDKGTIFLLDDIEITKKKIMSAVTDSENVVQYDEIKKPGISNLMSIMAVIENMTFTQIEEKYKNSNYGTFKKDLCNAVEVFLLPIHERYQQIRNSTEIKSIFEKGAKKARDCANKKIETIRKAMGIYI